MAPRAALALLMLAAWPAHAADVSLAPASVQTACDEALRADRPDLEATGWQLVTANDLRALARSSVQPKDAGPKNRIRARAECTVPTRSRSSASVRISPQ